MRKEYSEAVRAANQRYAHKYIATRTAGSASFVGIVIMVAITTAMIIVL